MYSKKTTIINETGLHARPASEFVALAGTYSSRIQISRTGDDPVDAKSIIMLLSLGLSKGEEVEISARGQDETAAVDELVAMVESGLGE